MPIDLNESFMRRAIMLSKRGFPAPNPHVGCVIVNDGEIVGEGWHEYAGGPHAEAVALAMALERAKGADVYVTLEPCNHFGKTPPCSHTLISAGVRRVFFAVSDPNPKAEGGARTLAKAGITIEKGLLADQASGANRLFLDSYALGRPFVVVKAGVSLDGRIALPSGESQWITSEQSRRAANSLRAELGAVLVGRKTVEKDKPLLTARIPGVKNQPWRIVIDPTRKISDFDPIVGTDGRFIRVVSNQVTVNDNDLPVSVEAGTVDLRDLLKKLRDRGIIGVLVEGGSETISSFFKQDLVDRIELFVAPTVLASGISWIGSPFVASLKEAPRFRFVSVRRIGPDIRLTLKRDHATLLK